MHDGFVMYRKPRFRNKNVRIGSIRIVTKVELIPIRPQNGLVAFACVEIDKQFYISSMNDG